MEQKDAFIDLEVQKPALFVYQQWGRLTYEGALRWRLPAGTRFREGFNRF